MARRIINLVCYVICMVCLLIGTVLGLSLIWLGFDHVIVWKGIGTVAVIFAMCLLVVVLNAAFGSVPMPGDRGGRSAAPDDDRPRHHPNVFDSRYD